MTLIDNLEAFVEHVLYQDGRLYEGSTLITALRTFDDLLEPYAIKQLETWETLLSTFDGCFAAGVTFLLLGLLANFGCAYM